MNRGDASPFLPGSVDRQAKDRANWLIRFAPSQLLASRNAVVPFIGRHEELAALTQWRDRQTSIAVQLVQGPGGRGKTRLAVEFGRQSADAGWRLVRARQHREPSPRDDGPGRGSTIDPHLDGQGLMVIVDYAEQWRIADLLGLIQSGVATEPFRVLLLARNADNWWITLAEELQRLNIRVDRLPLLPLAETLPERTRAFELAKESFASAFGLVDTSSISPPPQLSDAEFEDVLAIHAAALVAVYQLAASDANESAPDLSMALNNLCAVVPRSGGWEPALQATAQAVSIYRDLVAADPPKFEAHLASALNNLGIQLAGVGRRDEALTAIQDAIDIHRRMATASATLESSLANLLNNLAIDLSNLGRTREAVNATTEAVEIYRRLAAAEPPKFEAHLASALNNLGIRLSEVGDKRGALAPTEAAVQIYRRLAEANPAAYLPALAGSVNNLATDLGEAGRRAEALSAAQEAVALYRELAAGNPAAYLPDLAMSVNNLAVRLGEAGRRAEALDCAREASAHYHELARTNPDAFGPAAERADSSVAALVENEL